MAAYSYELLLAFFCSLVWASVAGTDQWSCYTCQAGYISSMSSSIKQYEPMVNVSGRVNFAPCKDKVDTERLTTSYKCSGADKCLKFTMKSGDNKFTYRSCATSNQCSAMVDRTNGKKDTYVECCTGNYCNTAGTLFASSLLIYITYMFLTIV